MTYHTRAARNRGLTLVELLIAVTITALVAAGVASMLVATTRGTSSRTDLRGLAVKHKTLAARLTASIRSSKMVLDSGSDFVVLWAHDERVNDLPNLSELQRIEWDNTNNEVRSYTTEFPGGWSEAQIEAADTQYDFTTDFDAETTTLKTNQPDRFPATMWGTSVTALSFVVDDANPQLAGLVSFELTVSAEVLSDTSINAVALRNE